MTSSFITYDYDPDQLPPDFPEHWELIVQEPSPAELAIMNENALSLLEDLVGEIV